ncbi:MAG: SPOR domain-containing protein [Bacteroidota bacterium]
MSGFTFRSFLLLFVSLMTWQSIMAQLGKKSSNAGEDLYYKFEREEVGYYRDKVDFQLPEPSLIPVELPEETPDAIRLSHLFPPGTKLYIDADEGLKKMIELDKVDKSRKKTVSGFRIQAYTGASRGGATRQKNNLMLQHPDHISYLKYEMPNFIVLIGDFMDKEEATLFCRRLRNTVPGAFVVPDQVKVPRYRPETEEVSEDENGFPKLPEREDKNGNGNK